MKCFLATRLKSYNVGVFQLQIWRFRAPILNVKQMVEIVLMMDLVLGGVFVHQRKLATSVRLTSPVRVDTLIIIEPRHEKTGFLHMRKQRRKSVSR